MCPARTILSGPEARSAFVRECRALVGTPYHKQARSDHAVDCVGLLLVAARRIGIEIDVPPATYNASPDPKMLHSLLMQFMRMVSFGDAEYGDLVRTRWTDGLHGRRDYPATHIGVLADGDDPFSFIHADDLLGRVAEVRFEETEFPVMSVYRPQIFETPSD